MVPNAWPPELAGDLRLPLFAWLPRVVVGTERDVELSVPPNQV